MSETVTAGTEATLPPRAIVIPEMSLVVMIGASGCGKSTFARTHFHPFETLSSDFCRGLVSNDENSQSATTAAFDVLHYVAAKRLEAGLLTVVDATNVQPKRASRSSSLRDDTMCSPSRSCSTCPSASVRSETGRARIEISVGT